MSQRRHLRPADDLLVPAVAKTVEALQLGDDDAALVALARVLASAIDEMSGDERGRMLGQTAGQLAKVIGDLHKRAAARGVAPRSGRLAALRAARIS